MSKNIKILDCTFRDGGYYNNWHFSKDLVNSYFTTISKTGVSIIEIGFRFNLNNKHKLGELAFTSEKFLKKIKLPKSLKYAVMINAKEFLKDGLVQEKLIEKFFVNKKNSKIHIVRIATEKNIIDETIEISKILKKKGYEVFVNLMQITTVKDTELKKIIRKLNINHKIISVFYIADSLGDLDTNRIQEIYNIIKKFKGTLGIHAHDNLNKALVNTLKAKELNFEYLDSTVMGMGRGAGNTKTEELLLELKLKFKLSNALNVKPLYGFIGEHFLNLFNKYKWGTNLYYYLSAKYQIHPTFVQKMLDDKKYKFLDIMSTIEILKNFQSTKFNDEVLRNPILSSSNKSFLGSWSSNGKFKNKNILIIGSGESTIKYRKKIENFIGKKKLIVFSLNTNNNISPKLIDYFCTCNASRFLMEMHQYETLKKPVIFPMSQISKRDIKKIKICDYGVKIEKGHFKPGIKQSTIPNYLSLFYLLGLIINDKPKNIFFAGMDGYDKKDINFKEINSIFQNKNYKNYFKNLYSLTPTNFSIKKTNQ